jgi:hypothetical protein
MTARDLTAKVQIVVVIVIVIVIVIVFTFIARFIFVPTARQ